LDDATVHAYDRNTERFLARHVRVIRSVADRDHGLHSQQSAHLKIIPETTISGATNRRTLAEDVENNIVQQELRR
jgi:hypothetical protein